MIETALFCIWLIPAQPFCANFQEQIQVLATTFDAPVFTPHVTLFCGKTESIEKTKSDLALLLNEKNNFSMQVESVHAAKAFYKTLYVQLENNNAVSSLQAKLRNTLDPKSHYQFSPHISLLYKDLSIEEKQKLIIPAQDRLTQQLQPSNQISFDKVALMSDSEEESAEAVDSWRLLAEHTLS